MQRDGKFLFMAEYSMKKKTNFTLIQLAQESYLSFQATIVLMTRRNAHIWGDTRCFGVHPLIAYTERLRRKGVPFSGFKYSEKCNSHAYEPLISRAFLRPGQGKPWTRLITCIINNGRNQNCFLFLESKC